MYAATVRERERLLGLLPALARRCGYLRLAHDAAEVADCRQHLDALRSDGWPVNWYDGPLGSGLLVPDDAAIDPLARCRAEAALVASRRARLFEYSAACRVEKGLVESDAGMVRCQIVIVAVDGGLARVLPELESRVWPMRLQMMATGPHHPGLLPHAIGTRWGWDYAHQLPDGTIAFGGCRDVAGDAERTEDTTPTAVVQSALEHRFEEMTGQPARVTHRWTGTGGYTADGLPVVEEVRPGVWATGGYCGTGNLFGAACARNLVQLALGLTTISLCDDDFRVQP
jgi:gamma-glutamylputrescine oxidase